MRGPKEKLKQLVEEKEQLLKYLERLNAQVQDGSLDAKERNFLISLKTMGLPPHEYLIRLNNQILHTSRYDETRAKTIKHASMVAGLFLFLAMFFYAFINPTLTGLVGLGDDQEFVLNINQNYTNGTTEYIFNINDVGNNTNNLTSLRITGTYSGSFIIKLVSDVGGVITEYVVYEPPVSDDSENMITGYAVREEPKTIEINDTEIQEPDVNNTEIDTEIDTEIIEPIINDTDVNESGIDEPIVNDSETDTEIIKLIINDTDVNESDIDEPFVNETGIITDFILPFTTITDVCIDTCNIEISPKNLSIVIEVIDGEFYLNKIIFTQAVLNQAPVQIENIPDVYGVTVIKLSEYFYDPEGEKLTYDLMSNPELEYSLDDNLLTITPISLTPQNFYVYSTDGDTVTISNTFKVYSQTQIPQEILDALLQDSSVRVIVKTQTNGVLLTSGKGDKSLRTTGLEDVGLDYSRMMGKKVLVTDENVPIEIKREVGDLKSVVVDLNLLNQLSIMPDIEEIVLDSKYSPLTNTVLNITKIESTKNAGYSGLGIKVCVLDTGLSSVLGYSSTGYNFVNNNIDYSDVNGHGTNVVYSLINSAPGIDLIVAKVIDDSGNGYASDILAGLNYCAAQNASIISMSIGAGSSTGYCDDDLVSQKVNELNNAGILVVVATGNDGSTDSVKIPSCASGALPVGASTKSSSIAGFSNYNNATLLVAPGQDVITKDIFGNDVSVSGTSISVPFVSGTAALLLENELLDSEELKELIVHTGDLIDYNGRQFSQLNAWNALIRNYTNNLTVGDIIFTNITVENYTALTATIAVDQIAPAIEVITGTYMNLTFTTPPESGSLVVVGIAQWQTGGGGITSINDNYGNTYYLVSNYLYNANGRITMYYAKNVTSGPNFSINITIPSGADTEAGAVSFTGVDKTSPFVATNNNTGTGTAVSTRNVTSSENAVYVAVTGFIASINVINGTEWITAFEYDNTGADAPISGIYNISTGTKNATWTLASSTTWGAIIAAFKAASDPVVSNDYAALDMSLINTYQNDTYPGSVQNSYGMASDGSTRYFYITSDTDDSLTVLNVSSDGTITYVGGRQSTGGTGSLQNAQRVALDKNNGILYTTSQLDDSFAVNNITPATPTAITGLQDTINLQSVYDVDYADINSQRYIVGGSNSYDTVVIYNGTNISSAPIFLANYSADINPCSVDTAEQVDFIPGTSYILVAAYLDNTLTVLNMSANGSLSCVTNYTDNAVPYSLERLNNFIYEESTGLVYSPSYIDDELTILNLTNPTTIVPIGSVTGLIDAASVAITSDTFGGTKYAFVGSSASGQGISIINVTDPANPTYVGLFNDTSGTCIYNGVRNLFTYGEYLYATSSSDSCFYVIRLIKEANAPIFTQFNGMTTNFYVYNSVQLNNLSGVTLEINSYGNIDWNTPVNVSDADFDTHVDIGAGYIYVNSSGLNPSLNSSANITFYNAGGSNVLLLKDGVPCTTCTYIGYSGGNLTYQVTGFSNYSLTMNITLSSPSNGNSSVNSPVPFISDLSDITEIINATLYIDESGTFAPVETRWNGEVAYNSSGLVALYHFNNESAFGENNTYMLDWSNHGINLSCDADCPPYNSGKFGLAQFKDNTYNSFSAPDNDYYSNLSYLTIIAWVNPLRNQSEQSGDGYIVEKRHDGTGGNWNTFYLEVYSNNGVIFNVLNETGDGVEYAWGAENSTLAGRWTMIAGRYNGTHLDTFVNGVKDTVSEYPFAGRLYDSNDIFVIGYTGFNGSIDEVAVWNISLSDAEIASLYDYTKSSFYPVFQNRTLSDGTYIWNVLAYDNISNYAWATSNFSFTIGNGLQCSNLTDANTIYNLTQNVSIVGDTCFSIQADNVTLDCDGYSITGDNTSSTYGVYSNDLFNTTVKNCLVSNFGTGVYFQRIINGSIINTIASTTQSYSGSNGAGIYIYDFSYNNQIINSTGNATAGTGIVLYWAYNTTISNSTGISNSGDGIYLTSANENTLYNFTGISNTERGIMLYLSHYNRVIKSNGTSNAIGVWLESSDNNAIIDSNAFGTHGSYGSILVYNADNSMIANNTIYVGGSGVGIAIMVNSDNVKVINTSIINLSSTMSRGIVVSEGANNAFIDCQGKSINGSNAANSYGVYSFEFNTTVKNCVISSFDNSIRLFGSNNGSFINNTFNARTGGVHVYLNGTSSRNTFLLNNFTATTGSYVNDLNGSNYYNGTFAGLNQGNIWANVINGTVSIAGTTASSIPGLTMGTAGTGYPYSNTTSLGKFSCNFASCADYAPLTNNLLPIVTLISPTVTTTSTPFFVSSITDNQEVINATIYTNESGWAARETRWNGEVAWNSTGLVALYHFNNESAYSESITNIYDFTGHGHTATTYGSPQIHNGRLGNALNLTGANMAAYAPDDPAFNLTIFTVSAWIVPHRTQSDNVRFVDKGYENSWFFGIGSGSGLDMAVWLNNTNVADSGEVLTIGVWQHVVATYNGSNVTIYLNANSVASGLYTNEIVGSNYALEIGGRAGAGGGNFNGSIDEVAIWNRSLSSTEIAALYDYSRTNFYPVFQKRVLNAGTNITWNVLAYDNQSNAAFASSNYSFLFQPIWNVFSFITPTMAHTNDTLLGYCQGNTSDSSTTLKYHYLWYRSNTPNATGSVSGIVNGTIVNVNNVSAASTTKDDTWILSCRVEQFGSNSSWVNSTAVNILNTAPVVTSSRIEPSTAYADDTLLGYCTATDVDSDTMTYHYRWFRNGVVNNTGSRTSIASGVEINVGNISASNLFINDVWEIECRADDLSVNSTAVNSTSLTISNYLPIVEFVTLNATSANNLTTDTLTVHFNQSDADGTAVYNITDWRRNNQSIAVLNMPFNTNFTATSNTTSGIIDYSIFANNASLGNSTAGTQPTWTTLGKIGGAYKFDGIDDFIRFNGPAPWNTLNNLTVSFWLNHTNSTTLQYVFNKYVSVNDGWGMRFTGSDGNWLALFNDIDNAGDTNVGGSTVNPGLWQHVVVQMVQVNATHYENRVYVNGAERGTRYNSSGSWASYAGTLYFGTDVNANFLNGTIDELQIFNRSLSSDQITAIYQAGLSNHSLDTIVNNETLPGEEWITCVTPSDGYDDGTTQCSNTLTIFGGDAAPTVALTSPSGTIASPAFFVSSTSDDQEVINATLYTNESGSWAAKETRWNGEVAWNDTGLVALWHFNNESAFGENSTFIYDWSNNNNNITSCSGGCPNYNSSGLFGGAYIFDKSSSFTISDSSLSTGFPGKSTGSNVFNLTFSIWVYLNSYDNDFICKGTSSYCFWNPSGGTMQEYISSTNSVATINLNEWQHLAMTYNGSTVKIFHNGQIIAQNDAFTTGFPASGEILYLGQSSPPGDGDPINGTLDEVAIWTRTLSDAEIAALYDYSRTNFYPVFQNRTLANGTYVWNVLAYDNQSQSAWASSNYTFIVGEVDTVPVVSLINPTNDETDVTSPVFFVSNVSDNKEVMNATLYTNESGSFAPVETRWNGEVLWNISGLIGLWHFNNESVFGENGTRIFDFSGYGNNGTCSGTSCPVYNSSGKFGSAYTYDGTNDIFTFGNSSILNPTQEITITAWARYVQETNYLAIITKDSGELSYWFGLNDYDITAIISDSGAHSGYAETSGLTNLAGNTWYHLALIYNGTHIGLYVNGTLDNTPLAYSGDIFSSTSNVVIGDSSYWTGNEWPGTIDDVAVWNRSLSATEIAALYDYSRINFYPVFQNRTLANGTYVWNVLAYDNQSQNAWASSTYSFTILPALECGNLDTPNSIYALTSNVSITGATCFTISAQNVTLNCNGYSITGDNTTTTYGVYTTVFNTTVKNCVVSNFMHGVYYYGADNGTILNTTSYSTYSTGNGIYLYNSAQYNGVIDSLGNSTSYRGIAVITDSNYNSIINSTGVSVANAGIRIDQSSNNIIDGCTGTSISAQGIFLVTDASYNTVRNSYAQTNTGNGAFDLYTRAYYNNITNCVGVVYGNGAGIYLNLNTNYTIVNNFTGISSTGEGIYVYRNNNITIINSSGAGRTGILLQNATEVTVSGSIMSSNSTIGALRLLDSDNNMIVNNTMNGTGTNVEAIEFGAGTYNAYNTFINNTLYSETNLISINSESGNNIFILNNFTATTGAFVNDANGTNYYNGTYAGLNQGNIYDNVLNGSVEIIGTTASSKSGLFIGTSGTGHPYSNTTSLGKFSCNFANCADYAPLTNDIGLQCGNLDTPNSIYSLTSSVSINGSTCFDVQAANITLDCNGYSITGNNTVVTYGIYTDQTYTTIKNCFIRNFSREIMFDSGATDSLIYNNTLNHTYPDYAIYLGSAAHRNIISANTIYTRDVGITVYGSNVTLDCQGKPIMGNGSNMGVFSGAYNFTVTNCNISNVTTGVYFSSATNSNIYNTIINSSGSAIYLYPGHYTTINNVTLTGGSTGGGDGIQVRVTNGTSISNVNMWRNYWYGLLIRDSHHGVYSNISVNMTGDGQVGLALTNIGQGSSNNTLNNITVTASVGSHPAISIDGSKNTFNKLNVEHSAGNYAFRIISTGENNSIDCQGGSIQGANATDAIYSTSRNTTVKNCIFRDWDTSIRLMGSSNGLYVNNTFIPKSGSVNVYLNATASGNKFILNNFTATTGAFVNDTNGSNHYNGTYDSLNQGNVWANVLNGSVEIIGITASSKSGLFIGTTGTGYPYTNTTSLGKFSCNFANCADYAPLTNDQGLQCGNLDTPNSIYSLTSSVSINGSTCFIVQAENVTLNCNGYGITGNNTAETDGVYSDQFNSTIQNCDIRGFNRGIHYSGATDGLIYNNTVNTSIPGQGIRIVSNSHRNMILSNTIHNGDAWGISVNSGDNVTIDCQSKNMIGSGTRAGIDTYAYNTTIRNCNISNFENAIYLATASYGQISDSSVVASTGQGIYLVPGHYTTINNVTAQSVSGSGIYLRNTNGTKLYNARISQQIWYGILLGGSSHGIFTNISINMTDNPQNALLINTEDIQSINNTFNNLTINTASNSHAAVHVDGVKNSFNKVSITQSDNNLGFNIANGANNSIDCQGGSITGSGVSNVYGVYSATYNTTVSNCVISDFGNSIRLMGSSNGQFINNTFIPIAGGVHVYLNGTSSGNKFILNNFTATTGAFVNDTNGTNYYNGTYAGLNQGNVWANVINGSVNISGSTASSKSDLYLGIIGSGYPYTNTTSSNKFSCNFANCADYAPLTTQRTMQCGDLNTANTVYTMDYNVSIDGDTCFTVTATNVTLDCNGYSITGNNTLSTYGVYSNQDYTAVKNCVISNFSTGVYYYTGADYSLIMNTIASTTQAYSVFGGEGAGILLFQTLNTTIINTTGNATVGRGIMLGCCYGTQPYYARVYNSTGISDSGIGLAVEDSQNNYFNNVSGMSNSGRGISMSYDDNSIFINSFANSSSDAGLSISIVNNITITGTTISGTSASSGALLFYNADNSIVANSTIYAGSNSIGIVFDSSGNNQIINTSIINSSSSMSSGISISDSNNTIDCQGKSITGTNTTATYGVYSNQYNTTVKNCNINNFAYAIYFDGVNNGLISSNQLASTSNSAIYVPGGTGLTIIDNNATAPGSGAMIYGTQHNISRNNLTGVFGIRLVGSSSNLISNNYLNSIGPYAGLYMEGNSRHNRLYNNSYTGLASGRGIQLDNNADNNSIIGINIFTTSEAGVLINSGQNNTLDCAGGTIAASASTTGISFSNFNTTLKDCIITNFSVYSISLTGATSCTFINNTFIPMTGGVHVYLNGTSSGNKFILNNFTATTAVYVNDTNGTNHYNGTFAGLNQGNIWPNVINGSVVITGGSASSISGLYIGNTGAGYPYNYTTSQNKFSCNFANCADYAPLTGYITNFAPVVSNVILNATSAYNYSTDNLTLHFTQSDANGDTVYNVTDWRRNGQSIAVLNMPFNTNFTSTSNATRGVIDYSSYGNNASLGNSTVGTQPTWTGNGKIGGAYDFDGSKWIQIPDAPEFNITTELTYSTWVMLRGGAAVQEILSHTTGANGYRFRRQTDDSMSHYFYTSGTVSQSKTTALTVGVWTHFAVTYNSVTGAKVYLNGVPASTTVFDAGSGTITNASTSIYIGTLDPTQRYFNGLLDETLLLNRELSPEQINEIYRAGLNNHSINIIVRNETRVSENWSSCVTASDGLSDSSTVCSNNLTIQNAVPTIISSIIYPLTAYTNDTLRGYCNAADPDDITLYYHYQWFLNGVANASGTVGPFTESVSSNVANISNTSLAVGQNWTLQCIADDILSNSTGLNSSVRTIQQRTPEKVSLKNPTNLNYTVHDRRPLFEWYATNHTVQYQINITSSTGCGGNYFNNVTNPTLNFTPTNELCVDTEGPNTHYDWQVRACGDDGCGAWSDNWNFSIEPYVVITIVNDSVNLGSLVLGETKNTTQGTPGPFVLQNDGNVQADLINASSDNSLWTSIGLGTIYYQMKSRSSSEANSFNLTSSITSWTNVGSSNVSLIRQMNYSDAADSAYVDVQVTVPGDEPPGSKQSSIIFSWEQSP